MRSISVLTALCLCAWLSACSKGKDEKVGGTTATTNPETPATTPTTPATATPATATPATATPATNAGTATPAAPEYYSTTVLDKAALMTRSLRELSLMRNTIFARAGNKFRKKWLHDYFAAQPWYQAADVMDESKLSDIDWQNVKIIAEAERSFSKAQMNERKTTLLTAIGAGTPTEEQRIELELVSRRLGRWVGPEQVGEDERTPLEDPSLLDRVLTLEQLADMSRKDLRILRNTVYARRGYPFKSPILDEYFNNMDWYKRDDTYSDARLTEVDWKNIKLVKSVENELGGPINDSMHNELDWFDAA